MTEHPDIAALRRMLRRLPVGFMRALEARLDDKRGDAVVLTLERDRANRVYSVRINSPPTVLNHASSGEIPLDPLV